MREGRIIVGTSFAFYWHVIAVVNEQSNRRASRLIRFIARAVDHLSCENKCGRTCKSLFSARTVAVAEKGLLLAHEKRYTNRLSFAAE